MLLISFYDKKKISSHIIDIIDEKFSSLKKNYFSENYLQCKILVVKKIIYDEIVRH